MFEKLSALRDLYTALRERPVSKDKVIDATERALKSLDLDDLAGGLDTFQHALTDGDHAKVALAVGGLVKELLEQTGFSKYEKFVELQSAAVAELLIQLTKKPILMGSDSEETPLLTQAEHELALVLGPVAKAGEPEQLPAEISPIQVIQIVVTLVKLWRSFKKR